MLWNENLERYDVLIDCADIKTLSRKMYETGKVSKKVLKKWRQRDKKDTSYKRGCCSQHWLPEAVFSGRKSSKHFYWRCRKCHCTTNFIFDHEATPSQLKEYASYIRIWNHDSVTTNAMLLLNLNRNYPKK